MKGLTLVWIHTLISLTFLHLLETVHARDLTIIRRAESTSLSPLSSSTSSITPSTTSSGQLSESASLTPSTSPTASSVPTKAPVPQDVQQMQSKRVDNILGSIGSLDNIPAWLSTLQADGKWPDSEVDYTTGCAARRANWPAQTHWSRILTMSAAWHGGPAGGDTFTNDPKLRDAISSAMNYWFGRDFTNPACLDQGGTDSCPCDNTENSLWNTNWFSNVILVPEFVGQACLLFADALDASQSDKCAQMTSRSFSVFYRATKPGFLSGANILDIAKIGIDLGLLNSNLTLLQDAFRDVHKEMTIHNEVKADGIQADGSFGQHGVLYNGNYGKDYTNDIVDIELVAANTEFAAGSSSQQAFGTLIDADCWMVVANVVTGVLHWDFSVLNRFISFPVIDNQATSSIKLNLDLVRELGQSWSSEPLTTFADTLSQNSTSANAGGLTGNRMFFTNDYMVHRGQNYVTTLKMYSSRTLNSECVNTQNPLGFHLSDGALHTYIRGDEYEDIAASWDWNLIPGTTVDYAATALSCDSTKFTGLEAFVGGVSDGAVGISAMRYTNPFTKSLSWQKAWFFLDDDVQHVMVSNLSSTTDAQVFSVLDQRRHAGVIYVDGRETPSFENARIRSSIWHGDVGYKFEPTLRDSAEVKIRVAEKTGNWSTLGTSTQTPTTVDLYAALIQHNKLSVPISYTVFPGTSPQAFAQKKSQLNLRPIQNTDEVSGVFDAKNYGAYIVFWNQTGGTAFITPSERNAPIIVKASGNLALIYKLDTGKVTVADPSQSLQTVEVTLLLGLGNPPPHWGATRTKVLKFILPSGGAAGSSVTQSIS